MVGAPVAPCLASYGGQELRPAVSCQRRKSEKKKKRKKERKIFHPSFPQAGGGGEYADIRYQKLGRCRQEVKK